MLGIHVGIVVFGQLLSRQSVVVSVVVVQHKLMRRMHVRGEGTVLCRCGLNYLFVTESTQQCINK